jgi:hypothetical protein
MPSREVTNTNIRDVIGRGEDHREKFLSAEGLVLLDLSIFKHNRRDRYISSGL